MHDQIVIEVGFFRFAARRFERRVNELLAKGYTPEGHMLVTRHGFRLIYTAHMIAPYHRKNPN